MFIVASTTLNLIYYDKGLITCGMALKELMFQMPTCQCVVCYHDGATKQDICAAHTRVCKGVTKLREDCVCFWI